MKKKRSSPGKHWHLYIDPSLADKVDLLLLDPLTNRPRYGARGQLIDKLLRQWLRSVKPLPKEKPELAPPSPSAWVDPFPPSGEEND